MLLIILEMLLLDSVFPYSTFFRSIGFRYSSWSFLLLSAFTQSKLFLYFFPCCFGLVLWMPIRFQSFWTLIVMMCRWGGLSPGVYRASKADLQILFCSCRSLLTHIVYLYLSFLLCQISRRYEGCWFLLSCSCQWNTKTGWACHGNSSALVFHRICWSVGILNHQ